MSEFHKTTRQVFGVGILRGLDVVRGILYVFLVPFLLIPTEYGKLGFLTSMMVLFDFVGQLGIRDVILRFYPQFDDSSKELKSLFNLIFSFRFGSTIVTSGLFLIVLRARFPEFNLVTVLFTSLLIAIKSVNQFTGYSLLGINRSLMYALLDTIRVWGSLLAIVLFYPLAGFDLIFLGLVLVEVLILLLGFSFLKRFLGIPKFQLNFKKIPNLLKFGFFYYINSLLLAVLFFGGETILRFVTSDYNQIAIYSFAANIALTFVIIQGHLIRPFSPALSKLLISNKFNKLQIYYRKIIIFITVIAYTLFLFTSFVVGGGVIELFLGTLYAESFNILLILLFGLSLGGLSSVSQIFLLVLDQPRVNLINSALKAVVFVGTIYFLFPYVGTVAAGIGFSLACFAGSFHFILRPSKEIRVPTKEWIGIFLLGFPIFFLGFLNLSIFLKFAIYGLSTIIYFSLLNRLKILSLQEFYDMWKNLNHSSKPVRNNLISRSMQIITEEGVTSFWYKFVGELFYRRAFLYQANFEDIMSGSENSELTVVAVENVKSHLFENIQPGMTAEKAKERFSKGDIAFVGSVGEMPVHICWASRYNASMDYVFYSMCLPDDTIYTYNAYTKPHYRGRHFSSSRFYWSVQYLKTLGYKKAISISMPENKPAIKALERSGYTKIGTIHTWFVGKKRFSKVKFVENVNTHNHSLMDT